MDVGTVSIGGMAALTIQITLMAQLRRLIPAGMARLDRAFDWLNYPLAFSLMLIANPPWPMRSADEWQSYIGFSLALAVSASLAAKKANDAQTRNGDAR